MTIQVSKFSLKEFEKSIRKIKAGHYKRFNLVKSFFPLYTCLIKRRQKTYDLVIQSLRKTQLKEEYEAIAFSKVVFLVKAYVESLK